MQTEYDEPNPIPRRTYEGPLCLHELITEQAERTPDRVAIRFESASLTYRELMSRAGCLARHLSRLGVGPDVRVGVCAERSLEMVVGLLGVLRAGGAYVPLDPSYPAERLAFMVEDAAAPVVLTQQRLAGLLPPHAAHRVLLDDPSGWSADDSAPLPVVPPDALAYVIYTSGSTGRPKGAMNSHRAVRNRLLWMRDDFGLGPDEVVLQKTPFSFDLSVWEIFATLMTGARLVMARPGGHQDSAYLVDVMEREGITIAHFVPSMLRAFLSAPGLERCTTLRRVLCTGEAVSEDLERRFFERFGVDGPELYNLYGPTEAAVEVTWWQCGPGRSGPVPIGRPLPNTSIHIVGPDLEALPPLPPLPPGGEGELLIGGVQPARGYLGRPDLTAERFIPDPFAEEPGMRLYRTGDLARFRPDGVIDFLGRLDFQVKVRGYRIELGEIESALGGHPAVHEAVAVARERQGEMRLAAYVVPVTGSQPTPAELRDHLLARLPDYMVPPDWVFLQALPLTASGKVDRKALPESRQVRPDHVPPRTPLERFLASLWEETLGAESVGVRDNFFDLGGTSISGAVVINRLQSVTGEILHVVALFDAPTIGELASYLASEHRSAVVRVFGEESAPDGDDSSVSAQRVDEARLAELRSLVPPLAPRPAEEPKNPPMLFVLAPPRSGTTLLRVMLGGQPGLFAPPELELLTFNTMDERRVAFQGRDSFWLEGVLRAVMELRGCALEEARELVESAERDGWTTRKFYRQLQEWLGDRLLVDKSTNYPLDPEVLRRAESVFDRPFYVHLLRHPGGMIHSFEEAKIDQLFFRRAHPFTRRELAELIWTVSQRNILEFLSDIPPERQHRLRFEDLVRDPEGELRRLCAALGIEYHAEMADPYRESRSRMTDGVHAEGRMLGDMKFHEHKGVDASVAERWRDAYAEDFLGEPTWETAAVLGYPRTWGHDLVSFPRLPRREGQPLPLSSAQERLWFLDRLVPGSPVYNACRELRLHGSLDAHRLAGALSGIVRRHEALRTVFPEVSGGPVQRVLPPGPVPLPVVDLSGVPPADTEQKRVSSVTARQPFDLRRGPTLRCVLLRLGSREHSLRLDIHHIATDGWSFGVLQRELEALYRSRKSLELPEPAVQYADFAVWQRRWLEREGSNQLRAWCGHLDGLPPALELPSDRTRPPIQTLRGGLERVPFPSDLVSKLEQVGRRTGATLFMTLLACLQTLLHRISGNDDLAVGVPSANRGRPELEGLIGFFVNNLVMRVDLAGDPTFEEALARVRESALFAYAHQDFPFERLVAELAPERDLSRSPVFQVAFSLGEPSPPLDLGSGLRGELVDVHTGTAKFDLWLQMDRESAGWSVRAEYAADLFDRATLVRWLGHLQVLLEGIAATPEARLSELSLLTLEEIRQLTAWNQTEAEIPDDPVHHLFRQWAERTPDALAISWDGGRLTYGELAARVDRLAQQLREQGVGPEVVVALRLERSPELIIAALAVLEAGGAYLPIDPANPAERIRWIVEDSGATEIKDNKDDKDSKDGSLRSLPSLKSLAFADSLAYVIYTSGSTGAPKGTEIRHRSLSSLIAWHRRTYLLGPGDRTTLVAGPGFDASVWETWAALTSGASLHIPPPETLLSPPALVAWMAEQGITVSFLPTPLAEAVLAEPLPESLALRVLLTGGDRLRVRPAPELPFAVINHYGPTENTVVATAGRVASRGTRPPEIGSPIANVQVQVLDRHLRLVPAGVPGELCLGGEGVARGYRARPELTAERFVPNPFGGGERLYRTGDLARWLPSGEIEFLGRIDQQVKIRGYRIELGEIEAALARHEAVREAAVLARDGWLVACVALRETTTADALRAALAASLPDVMLPIGWVFLDALPLTPNGKVDRRALARLAPVSAVGEGEWAPPATEPEKALAEIWSDLLGVDGIGGTDDFFALGGHSLLAARLAFRVRERFGVDLPLREVFAAPVLTHLAARIETTSRAGEDSITRAPRPAPASFAQQRLWFIERLQPGTAAFNMPFVLRFSGPLEVPALATVLREIERRHETLRTTLALGHETEPVQVVAEPGSRMLPLVDVSTLPETEAARLILAEARRPFDLEAGPLLRTVLLRLSDEDHRLLVTMHHAIADGWSLDLLFRELAETYRGTPLAPLPALPVQYSDFAAWQRRWLSGERLEAQLAFWLDHLAGRDGATELMPDRPRPTVATLRGARESLRLPPELFESLESAGRRLGTTPFVTFLSIFQAMVHRYTGLDDLLIGSPVAGRPRAEVEGLIGLFVNILPIRIRVESGLSFAALLERSRGAAVTALSHQDIPFERLVAELEPQRDLSRHPVFQLVLLVEDSAAEPVQLAPGLILAPPEEVGNGTAKFDLILAVKRTTGGSVLEARYASDLFDAATMRRLLGHFHNLMQAVAVEGAGTPISDLSLLDEAEREQVLAFARSPESRLEAGAPREGVHQLVRRWAERTPDAPAVVWEEGTLTYRELVRRADALAHHLQQLGVGPETLIALCMERSPELVISALGVLETGAAYLPIDPANPEERVRWIVKDSGAIEIKDMKDGKDAKDGSLRSLPSLKSLPLGGEGLAYVIYTSGSTGTPKGTELCHRGLSAFIEWHNRTYGIGPADRMTLLAGPGFDASVWDTWAALTAGASLYVPPREIVLSPAALLAWFAEQRITFSFLPTPLAEAVLAEPLPERLALRYLVTGGDRLRKAPSAPLPFVFINVWGPTETTIVATAGPVEANGKTPDIGKPVANARVHVLDPSLRPQPVGVPGEVWVAGDGLARAYRGRPALTAERFLPHPFGDAGERLYRTGDLARWLPDGRLDFVGRVDHQVKIRGIRIELGEIEVVLSHHPAVRQVAVFVLDGNLVAWLALREPIDRFDKKTALRSWLAQRLPEAMVPARWGFLDELPLNPNGKIDRRALAAMTPASEEAPEAGDQPHNPIEELVAALFAEILGLGGPASRLGNFFELGGHSLLAVRLAARISSAFGLTLGVRDVFEKSTVADLAERIAESLHAGRPEAPPLVPIDRSIKRGESPLSFAQERLWFLDRFDRGSPVYNLPLSFHIWGDLGIEALKAALGEIVRRHEVLRTTYRDAGGQAVQVVQAFRPPALPVVDLRGCADPRAEAARVESFLAVQPFDLVLGPIVRSTLLRLAAEEDRLVLSMHHIASDGWSIGVLLRELAAAYRDPESLPALPVQYADYALWQRRWLSGETLAAELAWWRERLAGLPAALDLPADRPRPSMPSYRGDVRRQHIGFDTASSLAALGRRSGATLFMAGLAAFASFLHRLTGEEDVVLGAPVANRDRHEVEGLIGFFVNTVVLRTSFAGDPSFEELLARVRAAAVAAYAHQELPFEKLVAELSPERDPSRHPLFQASFSIEESQRPELDLGPGLAATVHEVRTPTSKFDLSLHLSRAGDGLLASLEYAADLFDAATVERFLGYLRTLLAGIASSPERRISDLPVLTPDESAQLRITAPAPAAVTAETLHGLVEERLRIAPDGVAVIAEKERLTYAELLSRAEALAHRLRALGIGPEDRVALCAGRSPELVIGLLGILKAGGACVPLDPSHLSERLAFVLADSGAVALATTSDLAPRLPASIPRVFLDQLGTEMSPALAGVPPVHPEQLAYVIYTSGSTGRPKGVAVAHREAAEHFAQVIRLYGLGHADRVLQFASPAFDVAMEEILPTLAAGAAVVLREEVWDTETLAGRLEDLGITVLNLPSAVWHAWAQDAVALPALPARVPAGLRLIIVGGEEVLTEPARQWLLTPLAAIPVLNGYGPTEAVITATLHPIAPDTLGDGAMVPIGRPLPGRIGVVLDRRGNPVPPGASGELHLGGCLARGYLNRPDLTAERFVPDPLGEPGSRLYRSGDLVRVRHGALEFLGRIDQQVKIRGFRIEPAEIEAALTAHPNVAAAIVVVRGLGNEKQLAALIVPAVPDAEPPTAAGLRSFLEPRLPAWMVPAGFAFCDRRERLPLTSSGKVDRAAIARLSFDQRDPDEAPRSAVEQALAGIWQEVLNVERIGRGEDFFRLGGHSLLAMRLLSRIRASFGVDLELRDVFTAPTLAAQALQIEQDLARPTPSNTEALQPTPSSQAAPLSFAQQRLWFLDRLMGGSAAYNVPMAFTLRGPGLRVAALAAALGEIVRRHEPLRTVFEPVGGEPVQIVTTPEPRLPVADLAALPEPARQSETARLVREEGRRPFDLRRGTILRAALLRLSAAEHVLLLGVHHIAFDAWSLGVLRRELAGLYPAFAAGRPSPLPPLPLRYSDFAAWQRRWLSGEVLDSQLGYWREKLAKRPSGLDLPLDRPRPAVQSWRGGHARLGLPRELFDQLQRLGQGSHATPFMTLFAGYQTLLHRITGQDDFLVGTPVANRDRADVQGLIGFFVNTLVLRSDLSGSPGFGELLARVRETCVQAYAHQDLPFERLVTELDPARDLSRTPLFQTLFTWVPAQSGTTELAPGLTLETADVEAATSKFDISLLVGESQEGPYVLAEYAADLFDAASIRRLLGHLRLLLEGAAREPETPVSALPLLTAEERAQLGAWDNVSCRARRDHPCRDLLHGLFEAQARCTPDAPALVVPGAGDGTLLTYAELEERSGRLARRLRARGAGPEVGVAVCLRRSAKLVEALLAVLRSGAFYVPIDPSYPAERIAFLLEDSRCGVLLTESGIFRELGKLPSSDVPMILLDTDEAWEMPELEGGGEASPSNLAYLIYTSGSTGRPKAVAIEHRSAVTFALWARDAFAPEELRGVIASTAVTFDLSVFEIFVPLAWGGTVILVENALAVPELTARGMLPLGIEATLINTVPSAISVLLREGGLPRSVRTINLAGEALSRSLADRVHARPETERLNNLYGPSEDTTYSTWARLERTESTPRIGRPIDDTRAYVLDRRLERVPAGVPGELFLAGAGLARGYRGRPELTAERFLPDPFADSDRAGERMYRTGDRVRLRADYELDNQLDNRLDYVLDYLGRLDHQVKIRGFRIELGEIEEALAGQPGVEAAVVVAREDRPGDMRLIAYVVARSGATEAAGATTPAELRRALQRSLPEPMVPSLFVLLDALPLTPHGKVDRKALPAPEASLGGPQYVPPRTALEKELETAWKEVLGVERVGLEDSFWELGGHSLLATKALSRIYDTLGLDLPLQALFEAPTLGAFAERVGAHALAEDTEDDWSSLLSEMDHLSEEEVRVLLADEIQNG